MISPHFSNPSRLSSPPKIPKTKNLSTPFRIDSPTVIPLFLWDTERPPSRKIHCTFPGLRPGTNRTSFSSFLQSLQNDPFPNFCFSLSKPSPLSNLLNVPVYLRNSLRPKLETYFTLQVLVFPLYRTPRTLFLMTLLSTYSLRPPSLTWSIFKNMRVHSLLDRT